MTFVGFDLTGALPPGLVFGLLWMRWSRSWWNLGTRRPDVLPLDQEASALTVDGASRYFWQFGHQNLSRFWPGGPASPLLIGVPQRRHGRPARP
jgi:hypothetical protein